VTSAAVVILADLRQAPRQQRVAQLQATRPGSRWEIEMMKMLRRSRSKRTRPSKLRRDRSRGPAGSANVYISKDGRGRIIASR
jgi:hypothetical protein